MSNLRKHHIRAARRPTLQLIQAAVFSLVLTLVSMPAPVQAAFAYDGGYYNIKPTVSWKCLDVYGFSTTNGGKVVQWPCNGASNQKWRYEFWGHCGGWPMGTWTSQCFSFRNLHSKKCLDIPGASTALGAKMQQWTCNGTKAQVWRADPVGDYDKLVFFLYSAVSRVDLGFNRCLDVPGARTTTGLQLQTWSCNGNIAQKFYMYGFRRF